jgi:hypothetical protein
MLLSKLLLLLKSRVLELAVVFAFPFDFKKVVRCELCTFPPLFFSFRSVVCPNLAKFNTFLFDIVPVPETA